MSRTLTSGARLGRRPINSITSRSSGPRLDAAGPRSDTAPLPVRLNPCSLIRGFMRGSIRNGAPSVNRNRSLFRGRRDRELVEITDAVGLRPQPYFAGNRFGENVIEQTLAVQPSFELGSMYGDLDLMPFVQLERHVLGALLDEFADAFVERPEHQVVLLAVEAHRQVVAVRLEVEEDSGAFIQLAFNHLELHADFAVSEIRNIPGDRIGEVGEGLHVVYELFVARAVDRARVLGQTARRVAAQPLAPVYGVGLPSAVVHH